MESTKKTIALRLKEWGKRCFLLMWIPFTTLMIGLLTMPTGRHGGGSLADLPPLVYYSLIPLAVFFVGTFFFFTASMVVSNIQRRQLVKSGHRAVAVIKRIVDTRTTVNHQPLVGFELLVQPHGVPPFAAYAEQLVSRLSVHQFQVGKMVDVLYHPRTQAVVIVGLA